MRLLHYVGLLVSVLGVPLVAQQMKFIDLTATTQRLQLRFPPAVPVSNGFGSGVGGGSVSDCGVDARDPRSLTVTVQNVIARASDPNKPFEVEFKVLNTGQTLLQLPISPHLADLQPSDASVTFKYMSLALAVSPAEDRSSIGYVELYGKPDASNSVITLNPGEWLRVEANVEFHLALPPDGTINLVPGYWLREVTFHPQPGGFTTAAENICINEKRPTATVQVHRD